MGKHLTDTEVKNAKLPAGKVEHNLSDLAGLYLRLRMGASGSTSKTWRYRYTYLGETKLLVLGTYPTMSLASAREDLFVRQKVEVKHFDLDKLLWFIPKENQKRTQKVKPVDHYVDLSPFALRHVTALLDLAKKRKVAAVKEGKDPAHFGNYLFPSRLVSNGEVPADEKTFAHQLRDRQQTFSAPQTPTAKRRTQNSSELILPNGTWSSHDLRRSSSTMMRDSGIDKDTVDRCLNHVVGTLLERTYQKPQVLADMKNGWLALGSRLDKLTAEALADGVTHGLYLQKSIQRKAEKMCEQAQKMKLTKVKNKLIFGGIGGTVSPTK